MGGWDEVILMQTYNLRLRSTLRSAVVAIIVATVGVAPLTQSFAADPKWVHESAAPNAAQSKSDDWAADQLVVQARGGVSDAQAARGFAKHAAKIIDKIPAVHIYVINVPAGQVAAGRPPAP